MTEGPGLSAGAWDTDELISIVCRLLCKGVPVGDIARMYNDLYRRPPMTEMSREVPYRLVTRAALRGWLRFRPSEDSVLADGIVKHYPALKDRLRVVRTAMIEDVARHAAEMVQGLVQALVRREPGREAVHIGLGGGVTMRCFAEALADLLCDPAEDLPDTLCLHSLVAGCDPDDPTTVPSAFFTYFRDRERVMGVKPRFVGFNAPCVVRRRELPGLMRRDDIREARQRAGELDIVVATAADCEEHSALRARLASSKSTLAALDRAGWIGDMMWRPLAARRRIGVTTEVRAMTIIDLGDLARLCAAGKHVVLVLGTCPDCQRPRHRILRAVLDQPEPLATHLAVDSRTAARLLRGLGRRPE